MANLEPSSASAAVHPREPSASDMTTEEKGTRPGSWRRITGLLMLMLVIFLWTTSNFLASSLLADSTYNKPYFLTYLNTAFFILPMVPVLGLRLARHPEALEQFKDDLVKPCRGLYAGFAKWSRHQPLYSESPYSSARRHSASQEGLLGLPPDHSLRDTSGKQTLGETGDAEQLTLLETAKLGGEFCILWFSANYFIAACLEYTTVASSTIIASTCSVFALFFGVISGVERFTLRKLLGVLASLAGVALISCVDFAGNSADDGHRGDFPAKTSREIAIGDVLALASAIIYGCYTVLMKKRIVSEEQVNMPIFFGMVGLINVFTLWPGLLVLHWTGVETFELPPSGKVTSILICNSLTSMVADLAWGSAVVLTSPIVVTVGLSLTIPLSLVGQFVLHSQTASAVYWIGAIMVVLSFVFVNQEEKKDEREVLHSNAHGVLVGEGIVTDVR